MIITFSTSHINQPRARGVNALVINQRGNSACGRFSGAGAASSAHECGAAFFFSLSASQLGNVMNNVSSELLLSDFIFLMCVRRDWTTCLAVLSDSLVPE